MSNKLTDADADADKKRPHFENQAQQYSLNLNDRAKENDRYHFISSIFSLFPSLSPSFCTYLNLDQKGYRVTSREA